MPKLRQIDCRNLPFSPQLAEARLDQAVESFGERIIQRVLCFALYLLGLNRTAIGEALQIPAETIKSFLKTLYRDGLVALEDRRRSLSTFLPQATPPPPVSLKDEEQRWVVDFGVAGRRLHLSKEDPFLLKVVLLSLLNDALLSAPQVAEALGLTPAYTARLAQRLAREGSAGLLDQRQGQKQDYRVRVDIKAELVQQFVLDLVTRGASSAEAVSAELQERCRIVVPARTVRHHLSRMGLSTLRRSLPQLLAAVKKTSKHSV